MKLLKAAFSITRRSTLCREFFFIFALLCNLWGCGGKKKCGKGRQRRKIQVNPYRAAEYVCLKCGVGRYQDESNTANSCKGCSPGKFNNLETKGSKK